MGLLACEISRREFQLRGEVAIGTGSLEVVGKDILPQVKCVLAVDAKLLKADLLLAW